MIEFIKRSRKKIVGVMVVLAVALAFSNVTWAFSLGELADNIYAPTAFVTKFVEFGCYAVGIALALAGIMQIKNHQQNPKLVPLSTPIILFIISLILFILPFITKQGGASWSAAEKVKQEQKTTPAINTNTSPFSNSEAPRGEAPSPVPAAPVEEDSGHWGKKPQYQHQP